MKKRIQPSQVEVMCQEQYDHTAKTFEAKGRWNDLSERERRLITSIANSVLQRVLSGEPLPPPIVQTKEEMVIEMSNLVTFFRDL